MKPTKIIISPEVREFNEQVEHADFLLDYQFDQEPAAVLLDRLQQAKAYPVSAQALRSAMAGIAIKRKTITDTGREGIGSSRGIEREYNPAVGTWNPIKTLKR